MQRQTVLFEGSGALTDDLWETNGTAAGTRPLIGISGASVSGVLPQGGFPSYFTVLNGEVLFTGVDLSGKYGLWATNGTAAGTHEVTNIAGASTYGVNPADMTVFNGEVLFAGSPSNPASGNEDLWVTDGTGPGTHEITGISGVFSGGLRPSDLTVLTTLINGNIVTQALFSGLDSNMNGTTGLWVTNGTGAGTHELTGISGANTNSGLGPTDMTVFAFGRFIFNREVLFDGRDASGDQGLWVSDGTVTGTYELTGIIGANSGGLYPHDLTVFNSEMLFDGDDPGISGGVAAVDTLWVTNGTAAGTHEVANISGAAADGLIPQDMTVFNGEVLFEGRSANDNFGLWVTDGTGTGTHEITGINGASTSGLNPSGLTVFNGEVLFEGTDLNGKRGLWATNGTAFGTHELVAGTATNGISPNDLTVVTVIIPPPENFQGNNNSDILFRNDGSGDTGFYQINNGVLQGWVGFGSSSTAYAAVGVGDFNADGTADILFHNNATGDTGFYEIVSGTLIGWRDIGASSTAYGVVGVGDFNGDGNSDILYRSNATGDTGFYAIVNGANAGWHDVGASSTAYSVVGTGDFNGDGSSDILFRSHATGDTGFYAISNGLNTGWVDVGASSTAYSVVGVGDFNGDGNSDILFRNNATGDTGFYAISSGVNTGWVDVGVSSTAYSVVGTGDYNGDNTSDILFRNSTGDAGFYAIVNGVNTGWHDVGASSTAYRVVS
jgi:ELWxxDGT repeat protein